MPVLLVFWIGAILITIFVVNVEDIDKKYILKVTVWPIWFLLILFFYIKNSLFKDIKDIIKDLNKQQKENK